MCIRDRCYPVQAEVGSSGGYSWVRLFVAGVQRYAAVLADRCRLVTLSPGDAFTACVAQGGACLLYTSIL